MMNHPLRKEPEYFWPKVVLRKWLNIQNAETDFSADVDDDDNEFDSDNEEDDGWTQQSRFGNKKGDEEKVHYTDLPSRIIHRARRRNSETLRAQYINTKELRIAVGTWNVGGKLPPDDLDMRDWLDVDEPADIYVLGFQEIVPLNAGNVLGAENNKRIPRWEYIIRDTLNRVRPQKTKFKCHSDPPSPSKFKPFDDVPNVEDELINTDSDDDVEVHPLNETDSDGNEEVYPLDEECEVTNFPFVSGNVFLNTKASDSSDPSDIDTSKQQDSERQSSFMKRFDGLHCQAESCVEKPEPSVTQPKAKLTRLISGSQRISLLWPEPPLDLLAQHFIEIPKSFKAVKSFRASKTFRTSNSLKTCTNRENEPPLDLLAQQVLDMPNSIKSVKSFRASKSFRKSNSLKAPTSRKNEETSELALLAELDLEAIINRKRRSPFVRIVSKQMVGVFLTIWVRRSLRRHIQNIKVSTVGVGVMGYIGNKGSVSVSMSIYQTLFCFICTHLTSGEKTGDELRRNADVKEIHRRTQFHPTTNLDLTKSIQDHERIIWFGDLNYRINLPYNETRELIEKKEWSTLAEKDQLIRELKKGRAFDGWKEGTLNFPPTYKYEFHSKKYCGEDPKSGRRNPAWCDRILSYGKGTRLLNYMRSEHMLSDHRPVKAVYMAEVEVFCHKKLRKALAFTDAELEDEDIPHLETDVRMSHSRFGKDKPDR